jgi:hypothetical protein
MRKILTLSLIGVLGAFGHAMAQDNHVALFKNLAGDVKIVRDNKVIVPVAGTQLMRSDVVSTGPKSSGGIVFIDGTLLTLDALSEVEISRYVFQPEMAKYDFSLYLKKGTAIYSSGKLGKLSPESVNLNTPRATVGVRGTRFILNAN